MATNQVLLQTRYLDLFENAHDAIYTHDLNGGILSWNRAAERLSGYSRSEIVRKSIFDLLAPDSLALAREKLHILASGVVPPVYELVFVEKEGSRRTLEVSAHLVWEAGRPAVVECIARDITERKRAEIELQLAKEKAEELSMAKSRFLAYMSHEIRTPLSGVIGMSNLLLETTLNEQQQEYSETIQRSGDALLTVINDVLDFSKIEAGRMILESGRFSIRKELASLLSLFGSQTRAKRLNMTLEVDPRISDALEGDAARLRQVLINLVGNAVKFTDRGGIELRCELLQETAEGPLIRFEISDSGIGIPADSIGTLFDPFTQANGSVARYGGTGLGLSISRQIVELMGGNITLDSEDGAGSTFSFAIVLKHATETAAVGQTVNALETARASAKRGAIVLLADDSVVSQTVCLRLLEKLGCDVDVASEGATAVEKWRARRPDLVLLDCQMPGIDGYEAATRIRQLESNGNHTPIVALTANALGGDREKCLAAGMDDYVAKPLQLEQLRGVLEKWIYAHQPDEPA
ncbi:MAG TPA: ATP-binding protein [Candidatus Binatia bacterium]|nr:ATP-binding protein [Candidatus Binatia bacterium]